MEDWEPNKDEQKARRVAELAVYLMNAKVPVPSSQIHSKFYEWLDSDDSFDRAFNRDRAGLAACGLVLDGTLGAGGEKCWQVDAARSYSQGATLGAADAALLRPTGRGPGVCAGEGLRRVRRHGGGAGRHARPEPR